MFLQSWIGIPIGAEILLMIIWCSKTYIHIFIPTFFRKVMVILWTPLFNRDPSICLSCYLLLKPLGGILSNLLHDFPTWQGCACATLFFCLSIHLSIQLSISPSRYLLLNHWAESNQTCYMTSPHGKSVREQYYFSICHAISNISTKRGDFAMACHQLHKNTLWILTGITFLMLFPLLQEMFTLRKHTYTNTL